MVGALFVVGAATDESAFPRDCIGTAVELED